MTNFVNQIETIENRKYSSQEIKMQRNKVDFFGLQINKFNMLIVFSIGVLLCASSIQAAPADVAVIFFIFLDCDFFFKF